MLYFNTTEDRRTKIVIWNRVLQCAPFGQEVFVNHNVWTTRVLIIDTFHWDQNVIGRKGFEKLNNLNAFTPISSFLLSMVSNDQHILFRFSETNYIHSSKFVKAYFKRIVILYFLMAVITKFQMIKTKKVFLDMSIIHPYISFIKIGLRV